MPDRVHVIVTDEGDFGWSAASPQLPGFAYSRPTLTELRADLDKVLADLGVTGEVIVHEQRRYESPEGLEYVIRIRSDEHRKDRLEVVWRLESMLATEQRHEALSGSADVTGEVVFVCAVATDTMGDLAEQLSAPRDAIQVVMNVADQGVWVQAFALEEDDEARAGAPTLDDYGYSMESTVSELLMLDDAKEPRVHRGPLLV